MVDRHVPGLPSRATRQHGTWWDLGGHPGNSSIFLALTDNDHKYVQALLCPHECHSFQIQEAWKADLNDTALIVLFKLCR